MRQGRGFGLICPDEVGLSLYRLPPFIDVQTLLLAPDMQGLAPHFLLSEFIYSLFLNTSSENLIKNIFCPGIDVKQREAFFGHTSLQQKYGLDLVFQPEDSPD